MGTEAELRVERAELLMSALTGTVATLRERADVIEGRLVVGELSTASTKLMYEMAEELELLCRWVQGKVERVVPESPIPDVQLGSAGRVVSRSSRSLVRHFASNKKLEIGLDDTSHPRCMVVLFKGAGVAYFLRLQWESMTYGGYSQLVARSCSSVRLLLAHQPM